MSNKKKILSFEEFLKKNKETSSKDNTKGVDWDARRTKWIKSVNDLYNLVDTLIVKSLEDTGYDVHNEKKGFSLTEDYLGTYNIDRYYIKAENIEIAFNPIGSIILGAYGRVDMVISLSTYKLVMPEWGKWKIQIRKGSSSELVDFDKNNISKIFQENL